tara:strand:- start:56 stop:1036 length:981 start_codon:yes stop_codon:yes gene_type:complete
MKIENNSKILVTGGSGFIGTNLMEYLLAQDYEVINIDFTPPKRKDHDDYWQDCDIREFEKLNAIVADFNPTHVIHLAARTDLNGQSLEDYNSNTLGVHNLVKSLNQLTLLKSVVIASSMLVCRLGYQYKDMEDYDPPNFYGESKVQTEKITRAEAKFKWVLVRPTSIWGPWFGEPYRNFFDIVLAQRFFTSKRFAVKTYGYVSNAIEQIIALLQDEQAKGGTYYLGDYQPTPITAWAYEIAEMADIKKPILFPYFIFKTAALVGDLLNSIGIPFVMSSFRLKNMTTNNVVHLGDTQAIVGNNSVSRLKGTRITLDWLIKYKSENRK